MSKYGKREIERKREWREKKKLILTSSSTKNVSPVENYVCLMQQSSHSATLALLQSIKRRCFSYLFLCCAFFFSLLLSYVCSSQNSAAAVLAVATTCAMHTFRVFFFFLVSCSHFRRLFEAHRSLFFLSMSLLLFFSRSRLFFTLQLHLRS